jgi:hypothetical protein
VVAARGGAWRQLQLLIAPEYYPDTATMSRGRIPAGRRCSDEVAALGDQDRSCGGARASGRPYPMDGAIAFKKWRPGALGGPHLAAWTRDSSLCVPDAAAARTIPRTAGCTMWFADMRAQRASMVDLLERLVYGGARPPSATSGAARASRDALPAKPAAAA